MQQFAIYSSKIIIHWQAALNTHKGRSRQKRKAQYVDAVQEHIQIAILLNFLQYNQRKLNEVIDNWSQHEG